MKINKKRMTTEQKEYTDAMKAMNKPVKMYQHMNSIKGIEGLFFMLKDFVDTKFPGEFEKYVEETEKRISQSNKGKGDLNVKSK